MLKDLNQKFSRFKPELIERLVALQKPTETLTFEMKRWTEKVLRVKKVGSVCTVGFLARNFLNMRVLRLPTGGNDEGFSVQGLFLPQRIADALHIQQGLLGLSPLCYTFSMYSYF